MLLLVRIPFAEIGMLTSVIPALPEISSAKLFKKFGYIRISIFKRARALRASRSFEVGLGFRLGLGLGLGLSWR
jgi:hypothetical protein